MDLLTNLFTEHPIWIWLGLGAVLLTVEIATGTGWLLWSSACAAVVGVATMIFPDLAPAVQLILFAGLTIVSTLLSRRFMPKDAPGNDINDRTGELVGKSGEAVADFRDGQGRVIVDGAEWAAETSGAALSAGVRVRVVRVLGGARLEVAAD